MKNFTRLSLALALILGMSVAFAQQGGASNGAAGNTAAAAAPRPWTAKVKHLNRGEIDELLAHPEKVLFIDLRRPDEIVAKGTFPVYLNVQVADLKNQLAYIPKDRTIVTVSNHAVRGGVAGDILLAAGFTVAGAAGSEEYEEQGGTIKRIVPPPPRKQQ
jgi:rhodanese-related sulfurtransferase